MIFFRIPQISIGCSFAPRKKFLKFAPESWWLNMIVSFFLGWPIFRGEVAVSSRECCHIFCRLDLMKYIEKSLPQIYTKLDESHHRVPFSYYKFLSNKSSSYLNSPNKFILYIQNK